MIRACDYGHPAVVELIIQRVPTSVDVCDSMGNTLLHYPEYDIPILEYLCDHAPHLLSATNDVRACADMCLLVGQRFSRSL